VVGKRCLTTLNCIGSAEAKRGQVLLDLGMGYKQVVPQQATGEVGRTDTIREERGWAC